MREYIKDIDDAIFFALVLHPKLGFNQLFRATNKGIKCYKQTFTNHLAVMVSDKIIFREEHGKKQTVTYSLNPSVADTQRKFIESMSKVRSHQNDTLESIKNISKKYNTKLDVEQKQLLLEHPEIYSDVVSRILNLLWSSHLCIFAYSCGMLPKTQGGKFKKLYDDINALISTLFNELKKIDPTFALMVCSRVLQKSNIKLD